MCKGVEGVGSSFTPHNHQWVTLNTQPSSCFPIDSRHLAFDDDWNFFRGSDPNDIELNGTECAKGMFCSPSYVVSTAAGWMMGLEVPHDWSIEDLPDRAVDTSTPVLGIRNGESCNPTNSDTATPTPMPPPTPTP